MTGLLICILIPSLAQPAPAAFTSGIARIDTLAGTYDVILRPDTIAPEWWAGAPSVLRDEDGTFWLACRMRRGDGDRGRRGYEIRILKSTDGLRFENVLSITREAAGVAGFERPALARDPKTGRYALFGCAPWQDGPWRIIRFADADRPDRFDPVSARPVIGPIPAERDRDTLPEEYKDPVVFHDGSRWHCWVIGYARRNERIFHFTSEDGWSWKPVGDPRLSVLPLAGWHDFFVRPSSVIPVGLGWLFFYEGSCSAWLDPVYNILTGAAFTFDLARYHDLTPEQPLLGSATPGAFHTWRYSSWLQVGNELWAYAEVACADGTHEIRRFRFPFTF